MRQSRFPKGWDEDRVRRVLAHYESQPEEEAIAEDEAAWEDSGQTFMEIPNDLVPTAQPKAATKYSPQRSQRAQRKQVLTKKSCQENKILRVSSTVRELLARRAVNPGQGIG